MPCFFCIAVFVMLAGSITGAVIEQIRNNVARVSSTPPVIAADSASSSRIEMTVHGPRGLQVPVNLTVYKKQQRVRIQVMTHDVTREEAQQIQYMVAQAAQLQIVGGSDPASEAIVHETLANHAREHQEQAARQAAAQQNPLRN
jgi:hypothetical protein